MTPEQSPPLVLVSNRGPVTFQEDGSVQRGTGGLVTALTGLASHRDVDLDRVRDDRRWTPCAPARRTAAPFAVRSPAGGEYQVRFVASDPEAYDRFYNIVANPMLWFIQHYLWDLSNAPDIRRSEVEAFDYGYQVVNDDLARAVIEEIDGHRRARRDGPRLPPLHAARRSCAARARTSSCTTSCTSRGSQAGRLAGAAQPRARRALPGAAGQRHHRLPHQLLQAQLPAVLPRPARPRRRLRARHRALRGPRRLGPQLPAADRRTRHARRSRASAARRGVRGASCCAAAAST